MATSEIRLAATDDLLAINAIYNYYVLHSTTNYDLEPISLEARQQWFAGRLPQHPVTVLETGGEIVAWGALGPFRTRAAYGYTVENSVYVHPEHHRRGWGRQVMLDLIERAEQAKLHAMVAVIDASQTASIALHEQLGFIEVGRFPQIGRKFDRWLDVVFLQKNLSNADGELRIAE